MATRIVAVWSMEKTVPAWRPFGFGAPVRNEQCYRTRRARSTRSGKGPALAHSFGAGEIHRCFLSYESEPRLVFRCLGPAIIQRACGFAHPFSSPPGPCGPDEIALGCRSPFSSLTIYHFYISTIDCLLSFYFSLCLTFHFSKFNYEVVFSIVSKPLRLAVAFIQLKATQDLMSISNVGRCCSASFSRILCFIGPVLLLGHNVAFAGAPGIPRETALALRLAQDTWPPAWTDHC